MPRKRRRRRRGHRADGVDDDEVNDPEALVEKAVDRGKRFVLLHGLWLVDDAETVLGAAKDSSYTKQLRFTDVENLVQGQLREILSVLPASVAAFRDCKWFAEAVSPVLHSLVIYHQLFIVL